MQQCVIFTGNLYEKTNRTVFGDGAPNGRNQPNVCTHKLFPKCIISRRWKCCWSISFYIHFILKRCLFRLRATWKKTLLIRTSIQCVLSQSIDLMGTGEFERLTGNACILSHLHNLKSTNNMGVITKELPKIRGQWGYLRNSKGTQSHESGSSPQMPVQSAMLGRGRGAGLLPSPQLPIPLKNKFT